MANTKNSGRAAAILHAAQRTAAREHLCPYVAYVHEGQWIQTKVGAFLCETVEKFLAEETGAPYDILVLTMPPQHGKSMTITQSVPSWFLGKNPDKKALLISYNDELAQRFGRRNREKIERFGRELFGVELSHQSRGAGEFELAGRQGAMVSCGTMSGVTGRPADLMIIDDPIKNRLEADSQTYRARLWEEWLSSYKTRLAAGAKVILIQTRWHEEDLAGMILKTEPAAKLINLPCRAEKGDLLGRTPGQALCPELGKGEAWLEAFSKGYVGSQGVRAWNALFQGRPAPQQGAILLRRWWKFYKDRPEMDNMVLSVDAAFKGGEDNDYVCMQVWGRRGGNFYLVDMINRHLDFPQTIQVLSSLAGRYPQARPILIEDKANGSAVIQTLGRHVPGIVGVNPEGGKRARVHAVSSLIEGGQVYLPEESALAGELIEQCAAFPHAKHDDMVDAMSQALARLMRYDPPQQQSSAENVERLLSFQG